MQIDLFQTQSWILSLITIWKKVFEIQFSCTMLISESAHILFDVKWYKHGPSYSITIRNSRSCRLTVKTYSKPLFTKAIICTPPTYEYGCCISRGYSTARNYMFRRHTRRGWCEEHAWLFTSSLVSRWQGSVLSWSACGYYWEFFVITNSAR